jgi:hypothetical protein
MIIANRARVLEGSERRILDSAEKRTMVGHLARSGGRLWDRRLTIVAVMRDAMDPQFASNLSRLGQVKIHDAGKFYNAVSFAFSPISASPRKDKDLLVSSQHELSVL